MTDKALSDIQDTGELVAGALAYVVQGGNSRAFDLGTSMAAKQPLDADLTSLAAFTDTGVLIYRSSPNTWSSVTIGSSLSMDTGTLNIADDGVSNAKLANMMPATIKGKALGTDTGDPADLTATQVAAIANSAIDMSYVRWVDDFLGDDLDNRYVASLSGAALARIRTTGDTGASAGPFGGWLQLYAPGPLATAARLRLGADPPDDSGTDQFLPFNGAKNAVGETRAFLSNVTTGQFMCTIGFTAFRDPTNILGALYNNGAGWFLQTASGGSTTNVAVTFSPSAFANFKVRIETSSTLVSLYIDDVLKAQSTTNIPSAVGACWEFQLWNDTGTASTVEMGVDYLAIKQDR